MSVASGPPAKHVYPPNASHSVTAPPKIRVYPRDSPHPTSSSYPRRNISHSVIASPPKNQIRRLSQSTSVLTNTRPSVQQVTNQLATLSISRQRSLPTTFTPFTSQSVALQTNEHLKQQRHIITIFEHTLASSAKQQKEPPEQKNLKDQLVDLVKSLSRSKSNNELIEIIISFSRFATNLETILQQISPEDASTIMNFAGHRAALLFGLAWLDRPAVEKIIGENAPLPTFYLIVDGIEKWPNNFRIVARNCTNSSVALATRRAVVREFTEFAHNIFKNYESTIESVKNMPEETLEKKPSQTKKE